MKDTTEANSSDIVDNASLNLQNAADKLTARAASENVSDTDMRKINRDLESINGALQGMASMRGEPTANAQRATNNDNTGTRL